MTKTWQFRDDKPFLKKVQDPYMPDEKDPDKWEKGWRTHLVYDGLPVEVTWFPERMGAQISSATTEDIVEQAGREIALFGVILIKLMLSGADCIQEI